MSERHFKQKLYEAVHSLIGDGTLNMRLTYAAVYLVHLRDEDVPERYKDEFGDTKGALTRQPLSTTSDYTPRELSDLEADRLSKSILSMFVSVSGGL